MQNDEEQHELRESELQEVADTVNRGRKSTKARSTLRVRKNDLQVVAPYLWERRAGKKTKHEKTAEIVVEMADFSMDLADIAQLPQRLHKTANILKQLTDSNGVKLYLVDKIYNEIYFCPNGENVSSHRISWNIRSGRTIAAHVAFAKEYVLVNDLFADDHFPDGTGWGDPTLTSVICVPVMTLNEECSAVIELFRDNGVDYVPVCLNNPICGAQRGSSKYYANQRDLDTVTVVSGWMGSAIEQHQKRIVIKRREDINFKLMTLMQKFVSNTDLFEDVINEIVNAAKASISAQRGSFYVYNRQTEELETFIYDEELFVSINTVILKKLRKKIKGIALMAVESDDIVNIADAYNDPRFDKTVDQKSGFLTRSVLCMPIKDHIGCTGVIQIINKLPAGTFNATDVDMFTIFGTYCANIVNYKNQYDTRKRSESMTAVYNDIMMNRMKFRLVFKPLQIPPQGVLPPAPNNLTNFQWYPVPQYTDQMIDLSYHMLADICGTHFLNTEHTYSFLIVVRKLYRNLSYHNFEHSFVFMHCIYCILKRYADRFDLLEKLALLLGALCHDIDHPGYTNTFLKLTNHPLATLYDDSFLENHHYWLGQLIIKNTKVVSMLEPEKFARFNEQFRENIIATDLKIHLLDNRVGLETMCRIEEGKQRPNFDWANTKHRSLLRGLMMTTSDLAVQFKPFDVVTRVVENLMVEFYGQGDLEKKLGNQPIPSMDRAKSHLVPEIQVQFLRIVVLPCFDMMRKILPETEVMYTKGKDLKNQWMDVIRSRKKN